MIRSGRIEKGRLLYSEEMPERILGTSVKSVRSLIITQWLGRVIAFALIIQAILTAINIDRNTGVINDWSLLAIIAAFFILLATEKYLRADIRAGKQLKLYESGIEVQISLYNRLFKKERIILGNNITRIEILRYPVSQFLGRDKGLLWKDAPVEFILYTKDRKRYRSGAKLPSEVMKITSMMSEMWGIPIIDKGQGMGYAKLLA